MESYVLGPSLYQNPVFFDEWGRHPVYQDGGPCAVPLVSPPTLRDTMVMGRSDMAQVALGGLTADRSHVAALCKLGVVVAQSSDRL
ncbi:unnamed protein product [Sphagnum jensenii]|uniref:Uncharacterized protein n=1 Tax=Sphagnum jensenii TaxID=128206 RepID=A0ABP0VBC3_9BRYO